MAFSGERKLLKRRHAKGFQAEPDAEMQLYSWRRLDDSCSKPASTSITDSAGHFELERVREFRLYTTMGDHLFSTRLCIIKDGKTYIGYTDGGIGYPHDDIAMRCNIIPDNEFINDKTPMADIDKLEVCKQERATQ